MWKSGLIVGAIMLALTAILTLVVPACACCIGIFAGLLAGYLAGMFDRPAESDRALAKGAAAGALGGLGAILGGLFGGLGNSLLIGPEKAAQIIPLCGLPATTHFTSGEYYLLTIATPCCMGLLNLVLMAGLGAVGGLIWRQRSLNSLNRPDGESPAV